MALSSRSFALGAVTAMLISHSFVATARAATPDGAELQRAIERLGAVGGNVLYVAAHPDDENTRLLAWLVHTAKVRAAYLSLTRGEGGQNLIGQELSPLLGVIRTQELLAARSVDGAEQIFGSERDFGYSKNPEETLRIWGHDAALSDVVWAIRRFRPDVIVTRFSPEMRDTHGHHTASAMLAVEAFSAAADPKRFPEQLKYVEPWQAKRIVWNRGFWVPPKPGETEGLLPIEIGTYDPLLGSSAGEIAARSRSMHKSQGFGASPQRGSVTEYVKLLAGEPMQRSLLDGVELGWKRVPGGAKVGEVIERARVAFRPSDPAASVPVLLEALAALEALPDSALKTERRGALTEILLACAGIVLEARAENPTLTPEQAAKLTITAINRSPIRVELRAARVGSRASVPGRALPQNQLATIEHPVTLATGTPYTTPYWLADAPSEGRWQVADQQLIGQPAPPPLTAHFELGIDGRRIVVDRPVEYIWNDPVAGERRRPVAVVPAVIATPSTTLVAFPGSAPKTIEITLRRTGRAASGTLRAIATEGFTVEPAEQPFALTETAADAKLRFQVKPTTTKSATVLGALRFATQVGDQTEPTRSVTTIDYGHIPPQTIVEPTQIKLSRFPLERGGARIGYIPGAGDEVASALTQAGYDVTTLSHEALAAPLASYAAIVVGIRAFNVDAKLAGHHAALMKYVEDGGTLLVQYNTSNRLSTLNQPLGPWPFAIGQERVTEENAAIERLVPHEIFARPNAITDDDFVGWVQERGLYFATTFDEKYVAPIGMHDTGEPVRKGALLIGDYGKGRFVYTGLAFFRQLPAGVPGAFRLFANLIAGRGAPRTIAPRAKRGR